MKVIKYILFIIIFIILSLPLIQKFTGFAEEKPLMGDFIEASRDTLKLKTWLSEEFQNSYDNYFNETVGFRNNFVRLNNQIDFSFFNIPHAEGVIAGKENCFYEKDYIMEYTGKYFIGEDILTKKIARIEYLQKYLKAKFNTDLVIVFAPGKASYYPECIPGRYYPEWKTQSNYEFYTQKFKERNVKYIDFNKWFVEMKDTTPYPLYTKFGIHWTAYGSSLAIDSIINYIEHIRKIDLIDYHWDYEKTTYDILGTDYDIGDALNLMYRYKNDKLMCYPKIIFHNDYRAKSKPNILTIGDSYYWNIFNSGIPENVFNNKTFWLYGNKIYPEYWIREKTKAEVNIIDEVLKQDVVFVMITERFVFRSFWKFIDELYALFHPNHMRDPIYEYINDIVNYDEWYQRVYQQSIDNGISFEQSLKDNAAYMAFEKNEPLTASSPEIVYNILLNKYIKNIENDPVWYEKLRTGALEQDKNIEDKLYLDADWIMNNDPGDGSDPKKRFNKILEYYNIIRNDSVWLSNVRQKAIQSDIPLEEMIVEDAIWLYDQELNKE